MIWSDTRRRKRISGRFGMVLLAGLAFGAVSPARADSWIVYGEGKDGARSAMLLDEASLVDRSAKDEKIYDIKGSIVFEDRAGAEHINLNYRVYCGRGTLEGSNFFSVDWKGKATTLGSGSLPEHKPGDFSEEQVLAFTCANAAGRAAGQFIQLNDAPYPQNYIRNIIWADPKLMKDLLASVDASLAAVASGQRAAQDAIDSYNRDTSRQGGSPALEAWLGQSETRFVQVWGTPNGFADNGGTRELHYSWGGEGVRIMQGGNQVGEQYAGWCAATIYVRDGKVWDYKWDGNSCRDLLRAR
jgi:hypothetical protein